MSETLTLERKALFNKVVETAELTPWEKKRKLSELIAMPPEQIHEEFSKLLDEVR